MFRSGAITVSRRRQSVSPHLAGATDHRSGGLNLGPYCCVSYALSTRLSDGRPNYHGFQRKTSKELLWIDSGLNPTWARIELAPQIIAQAQAGCGFISHYASISGTNHGALGNEYNMDLIALCKQGRFKEALDFFDVMDQQGIGANSYTYGCLLQGCIDMKALAMGKRVHAHLIKCGFEQDMFPGSALVRMYTKCGSLLDARQLFDKMPKYNVFLWNVMIAGYVGHGHGEEAYKLFQEMLWEGVKPDKFIITSILKACASLRALEEGKWVHAHIIKTGIDTDVFLEAALVDMYAKCGSIEDAREVFNKMSKRDLVSWNVMFAGYAQHGCNEEALDLFRQMQHEGVKPDVVSWNSMIAGCAQHGCGEMALELFYEMRQEGMKPDVFSWTTLIAGYAQHGHCDEAVKMFQKMQWEGVKPNVVSWTAIIKGYMQHGHSEEAFQFFEQMQQEGMNPDLVTWNVMIAGYAQHGHYEEAFGLFRQMQLKGMKPDVVSWNSIIAGYAHHGHGEKALDLFQQMKWEGLKPNVVSWNAMIAGCAQHGHGEEALRLFWQMQQEGIMPNSVTFISIFNACASIAALEQGKRVHRNIIKTGCALDLSVGNALVDMYAKCGSMEDACQLFDKMSKRDVVSWNVLISGYAINGYGKEAFQVFEQMLRAGLKPNHLTFTNILTSCSHAGLVDEGRHYFNSISQDHGMTPIKEHYACMVDLLGRAACLNEAVDLSNKMPFQPDAVVWQSLLCACRTHGNVELAELATEHTLRLEPENSAPYVLLSNIYAAAGRWKDRVKMRKAMVDRGVKTQ